MYKGPLFKTEKILKAIYYRIFRFAMHFVVHLVLYFLIFLQCEDCETLCLEGENYEKLFYHKGYSLGHKVIDLDAI